MMMTGFSELLLMLLMGGAVTGGGMLGYPPGERDAAFVRAAPADSLVYLEWAERSGGTAGAEGVDGFAADPEVRLFVDRVEKAMLKGIRQGVGNDPNGKVFAESIPQIVKLMLVKPGCLYGSFNEEAAAKAIAEGGQVGPGAVALGIEAVVIVNAGEDAEVLAKHINAILDEGLIPANVRNHDLAHQIIPLPIPSAKLEIHREGSRFILAFGDGLANAAIAAMQDEKAKGIATSERFTKAIANAETERVAGVAWIDVKGTLGAVVKSLGFQGEMVKTVSESLGLDAIDSFVTVNGVVDGRMSARSFLTTGGSVQGLLALVDGRPLTQADFASVPSDADFVYAISLDGKKLFAAARSIIGKSDPTGIVAQQMEAVLDQLDEELGFSIEDDALAAFGDVWTLFDSPAAGGLLATSLTASLEVRDHERAKPIFERLMAILEASLPGVEVGQYRRSGAELRREEFMDHEILFLNTIDDDMPFAPAFCLSKSHLYVAMHPQAMKAQLRALADDDETGSFAEKLAKTVPLDAGTISVHYVDTRGAVRALYAFVPFMAQSMAGAIQQSGGEFTVFAIPSARALLPYSKDSFGRVSRTQDGIRMESYNGVPVPGASSVFLRTMPVFFISVRAVRLGADEGKMAPRAMAVPAVRVQRAVRVLPNAVEEKVEKPAAKPVQKAVAPRAEPEKVR